MSRQQLIIILVLALIPLDLWAQSVVTGQITDELGNGLPGVNILILGTAKGTVTDGDGNYNLEAPDGASLQYSFVGYHEQQIEVNDRSLINISLQPDAQLLDEIVVTAFGMEKEKKALPYSVTEVPGEEFTEAREINMANALAGKIAGVNVSNIGSGVGGSSRVVIRGNTSISGNNQPLYVVDGVPMDNTQLGQAGMWGGADFGDGTSSMSPDDIESISVLKGNTASALYGSRAANGVIMITTKKGENRKGIGIEINSNFTAEQINNLFDFQKEYGHGNRGEKPTTPEEAIEYGSSSWGGKLDGSEVYQFDGVLRPYRYQGDNFDRFYRTGTTFTNSVALTGGGDKQTFRFSASDLRNESVIPNSGMNRQTFSLATNANWVDKLTLSSKLIYSREDVENRPRLSDRPANANSALSILPPSINVVDLKGPTNKLGAQQNGTELQYSNDIFDPNPYWAAYQFSTEDLRDRVLGSALASYQFTDWLFLQGRIGIDWYTNRRTDITPYGTAYSSRGQIQEAERRVRETNMEILLGADHTFGDFKINGFVGGNRMRRSYERLEANGSNFNIPFFHTISNAANQNIVYEINEKGINSIFGSVEFSYKNFIFLTATGRNDWFSTLNPENNSSFYPSVGASVVFTDAFQPPDWLSFGKIRASWAETGGDTDPYQTTLTYSLIGQGHLGAALGGITQTNSPNFGLQPLTVSEVEVGFDLRFFDNRLDIDYAFYSRKTFDDIVTPSVSNTTGYQSVVVNVGEITNQGHELLVTGTPIAGPLRWDISFNFAHVDTEVVRLYGDQKIFQVDLSRSRNAFIQHRVEYTDEQGVFHPGGYSMIVGRTHKTLNGQKVYTSEGYPVPSDDLAVLGSGVHPTNIGVSNTLAYKRFELSFLLDMKFGGDLYLHTNAFSVISGNHNMTVEGRDNGLTVSGVDESGDPLSLTIPGRDVQDYWARHYVIPEYFVQNADFIKLRQLIFAYNFSSKSLSSTPFSRVRVSLVARNLWLIYSNIDNVDPEQTYNSSNAQGLESFGVPQAASYGVNFHFSF